MADIEQWAAAFETFDLSASNPAWSSWLLDRLIDSIAGDDLDTMMDLILP